MKSISLLLVALLTLACTASESSPPELENPPNIIFLIGDGMGLSAVSTGFYFGDQPSVLSALTKLDYSKLPRPFKR